MPVTGVPEMRAEGTSIGADAVARRWRPSPAHVFLAADSAVALAAGGGAFGASESFALFVLGVATVAALVISVWLRRPSKLWPWASVALAFALFLAGGVTRAWLQTLGDLTVGRSLVSDLVTMPGFLLLRGRSPRLRPTGDREAGERRSALVLEGRGAGIRADGQGPHTVMTP